MHLSVDEGMMMRVRADAEREQRRMSNMPLTWLIEALRSGRYTQGRGFLAKCDEGGDWKYCCLGVACELYQVHVGGLRIETVSNEKRYEGCNTHLPTKVEKWLGFTGRSGGGDFVSPLPSPDGRNRRADMLRDLTMKNGDNRFPTIAGPAKTFENLVDANDDGYFTFAEIADILDAGKVKGTEAYAA